MREHHVKDSVPASPHPVLFVKGAVAYLHHTPDPAGQCRYVSVYNILISLVFSHDLPVLDIY